VREGGREAAGAPDVAAGSHAARCSVLRNGKPDKPKPAGTDVDVTLKATEGEGEGNASGAQVAQAERLRRRDDAFNGTQVGVPAGAVASGGKLE